MKEELKFEDLSEVLSMVLQQLQNTDIWYKYTNQEFFSQMDDEYFFVIKRKSLYYYKINSEGMLRRMDFFSYIERSIEKFSPEEQKKLIHILEDYRSIVELVILSGVDLEPLITNIFDFSRISQLGNTTIYRKDGQFYNKDINSMEELDNELEFYLDDLKKVQIGDQTYYRDELLTKEYQELEKDVLIEQENYEILSWFQKIQKEKEINTYEKN